MCGRTLLRCMTCEMVSSGLILNLLRTSSGMAVLEDKRRLDSRTVSSWELLAVDAAGGGTSCVSSASFVSSASAGRASSGCGSFRGYSSDERCHLKGTSCKLEVCSHAFCLQDNNDYSISMSCRKGYNIFKILHLLKLVSGESSSSEACAKRF